MAEYFPELKDGFKKLLAEAKGKKIAVAGHMRPDGDCVSSEFALADILEKAGAAEAIRRHTGMRRRRPH